MKETVRTLFEGGDPMHYDVINQTDYTKEQADQANLAFDESVKQVLHNWLEQGTVSDSAVSLDLDGTVEEFLDTGALRSFFKHRDDALELLLQDDDIARHLLRPISQVYFVNDAYEPLLAQFERRIYNLAAHREHLEVPFRYSSISRQGDYGDTVGSVVLPDGQLKEDIGMYFGTRRSDMAALTILANDLHREALLHNGLPIHVVTEGYMEDALRAVRTTTEQLQADGDMQLHCFVIQRRHAADDRHLGAALLIINPQEPGLPQRIIFCDTLNPSGRPPWWNSFRHKVDAVFPQSEGSTPASDKLEDGGVKLQRLHDGVPVRHQDIDCAFYTASIGRALIQLAKADPELLVCGPIAEIVSQMTSRMPEYYTCANQPKAPEAVREVNVVRRWNTGRQALMNLRHSYADRSKAVSPFTVAMATAIAVAPLNSVFKEIA